MSPGRGSSARKCPRHCPPSSTHVATHPPSDVCWSPATWCWRTCTTDCAAPRPATTTATMQSMAHKADRRDISVRGACIITMIFDWLRKHIMNTPPLGRRYLIRPALCAKLLHSASLQLTITSLINPFTFQAQRTSGGCGHMSPSPVSWLVQEACLSPPGRARVADAIPRAKT